MRLHDALMPPTKRLPVRLYRTGAISTPTWRTALLQRWCGSVPDTGSPAPPTATLAPSPDPGSQVSAQLPLPRKSRRGQGDNTPTPHQADPRGIPRLCNEPGWENRSGPPTGLGTALEAGTLLPTFGSAAPRQRRSPGNRGSYKEAEGPSDSSQRAPRRRSRPRRRRRRQSSISAPGPFLASRPWLSPQRPQADCQGSGRRLPTARVGFERGYPGMWQMFSTLQSQPHLVREFEGILRIENSF